MSFAFLSDLCESHLIPSQTSLKHWSTTKLSELAYLYFLGLRILLADDRTKAWARDYCKQAGSPNDFKTWRTTGNDLYVLLFALSASDEDDAKGQVAISPGIVRHWLRHVSSHDDSGDTDRLFMRLDAMFKISSSSMRSIRRIVMEWDDTDSRERHDTLVTLIQMLHARAPTNSEIMPQLKKLSADEVEESASSGATGAANVATVVGGLGAGFDPNGHDRSIYGKPPIIRR